TVRDEKGAGVPGAQVEIINPVTSLTERSTTSDASGNFTATQLPVGTYRLEVSAAGFSKAELPDIKVNVTETTTVNVPLKVGDINASVTVTDAATEVQLTTATTGQTLGENTIGTLPLSTRNFLTLLTLSPGANTELFQSDALGRGAVTINVNGQRPVNNNYQLEGINANDINLPVLDNVPLPNPQTVQEFKTQTSLYDASQGRNGGGNIQVALKSGSNEFHGDAFVFIRNNIFNANDFFNNAAGVERPVNRQGQYGFSIGGPIYLPRFGSGGDSLWSGKGRHFFFFNYQGTNAASGAAALTNFSTTMRVIPTNRSEANLIATFFPGGLPPGVTGLDPVVLRLLNLPGSQCPNFGDQFCIPSVQPDFDINENGTIGRLVRTGLGTFEDDQWVLSTDHQLTTNNRLTFRYFNDKNTLFQPFASGSTLPQPRDTPGKNRFVKLGLTSVLTPTFVNELRLGYNFFSFSLVPTEWINLADIGQTRANASEFPAATRFSITGAGGFQIGTGVNDDRGGKFHTYVIGDDMSWTRGSHTFRFGGEGSHYKLNRFNNFAVRGSLTFGAGAADDPPGFGDLSGFQNFLLGRVTGGQGNAGFATFFFRATDYAFYVQDDWKVNSRLTLNLGVRYELLSVAHEKQNFLSNLRGFNDGEPGPVQFIHPADTPVVGTPGVSRCTLVNCYDTNNWGPRVGFAYDLFGDQKTVLRGGYGIYYQRTSNQPLLQTSGGLPFSEPVSPARFGVTTANPFPSIRPSSDFPLATDQRVPRLVSVSASGAPVFDSGSGGPFSGFLFYPSRDFHSPYAQQWNLTVQREVRKSWVAEIGYVGTRGVGLIGTGRAVNPSQICTEASPCIIPASIASGATVDPAAVGVTRLSDGSIAITASTFANRNLRVPANYLGIANNRLFGQEQRGASIYHSLQSSLTHRFSDGLYFQAAYTFSKSIDNGSGSTFQDELNGLLDFGNQFDPRDNRGLSDFDRKHRFVLSYNWELPVRKWFGIEDKGFGRVLSGWSLNGIFTAQSGTPFNIFDSGAATLQDMEFNNGVYKATYLGGPILTTGSIHDRLNSFVNFGSFLAGGHCVNNQNVIVACTIADGPDENTDPDANPDAIAAALGNLGRNIFRGPFQTNWDMSFVKITKLTESTNLEFRAEFFNILNHPAFQSPQAAGGALGNFGLVDVTAGDSSILATANRPRTVQFALKLNF
ncbi:MAG TPA: TonB-dependent receptor, partial [Pyrinomonadaceae bacterium]|nr:TonB-dependent receptor [Pyrinomonadaceae bacterium]